ncbi:hypothetical protein OsJ_09759 [Oryza sativa Japonica Group]|uniref:AIR12 DOMON domain-containing protein n=1 Tax=Oryza sativa subsp. japonica TaxID=39947 RepID=A3AF27_ORYSJ|nr:hypothetical protein OsJ_09759 [Oryza sativa Japonica Group]
MARLGRSAWLLAAAVLLYAAAAQPDCANATFQAGRTYRRCDTLPSSSGGWVAWGINTQGAGMVGSSVFIASQINATGAGAGGVSVVTTVLESFSPSLRNGTLRFDVPAPPAAEYSAGAYTIYATVALPGNSTTQNMVWQAGPVRGGAIAMHPTTGANLRSTKKHDFTS